MISLLSRLFIKDCKNTSNPRVRRAYGTLCGILGIILNILLCAGKFAAGAVSGSIAVTADAFNNLSDALSSLITLAGFRLAGKKPDLGHPFGHGRIEYISGLAVSALIIVMGFDLGKSSVLKIITPEEISFGALPAVILAVSIAVKLYMFSYNRSIGGKISSSALKATGADSLSDVVATTVVFFSMLLFHFSGINIDAWAGLAVAVFILVAGCRAAKETLTPLLGQPPDREFVTAVYETVLSHEEFVGVHDLVVHDYGPGRRMISLHGEMPGNVDVFELHEIIDRTETELQERLSCHAVIHLDPVETDNGAVSAMREKVSELVTEIDERITIHDFRMVPGREQTKLIFDAVLPYELGISDDEAKEKIERMVAENFENHFAVILIDKPYS